MSIERRSCVSPAPHVTKRLLAVVVLMTGLLCMFGGYLLGRMTPNNVEHKKGNDLLTRNLTSVADTLYNKAKRITPKVIHNNDSEKVQRKLSDIFNCSNACGTIHNYNLAEYVKNTINYQVMKLIRSVYNASLYIDSLS